MSERFPTERIAPPLWNCCMLRPTRVIIDELDNRLYCCPPCAGSAYGWRRAVSLQKPRTADRLVSDAAKAIVRHMMDPTQGKLDAARLAVAWSYPFLQDLALTYDAYDLYHPALEDLEAA